MMTGPRDLVMINEFWFEFPFWSALKRMLSNDGGLAQLIVIEPELNTT
jgi:hypothetical protein